MSDFVLLDFDYEPYLTTDEQSEKFARMKELIVHFHKPIAQCWQYVEEFENLHRQIINKGKQLKIIPFDGTQINCKPDLN